LLKLNKFPHRVWRENANHLFRLINFKLSYAINNRNYYRDFKKNLDYLQEKYSVKNIGLFSSWVTGQATQESDIDLIIEFDQIFLLFCFI